LAALVSTGCVAADVAAELKAASAAYAAAYNKSDYAALADQWTERATLVEGCWQWLESRLHYTGGEFNDPAAFARLKALVDDVAAASGAAGNTLLYLAISPDFFGLVNQQLDAVGFTGLAGQKRIIVEKPFGKDLASAQSLNQTLLDHWREEEIYRIDHYLGKETVQNLLAFRLANGMFAPLWDARHIDHIQISATETVGVETRGGYYDKTGVVRDMLHQSAVIIHGRTDLQQVQRFVT
jgi:glucose-6-phosphate 1-dehydrogenase